MRPAVAAAILALTVVPCCFDIFCADPLCVKLGALALAAVLGWNFPGRGRQSRAWWLLAAWFLWSLLGGLTQGMDAAWLVLLPVMFSLLWSAGGVPTRVAEQAALAGWGFSALYSWVQRLGWDPVPWSNPDLSQWRTIAGLGNPNYLSMYLAALFPLAWGRLYPLGPPGWFLAMGALSALFLTATRGSILALLVAFVGASLFSLIWRRGPGARFWAVSWILCGSTFASSWQYSLRHQPDNFTLTQQVRKAQEGSDLSVTIRFQLWRNGLSQALEHPLLGVGAGNFGDHYLKTRELEPEALRVQQRRPEDPHNQLVRVLAESGWVGLALWLSWLATVLRNQAAQPGPKLLGFVVLTLNGLTNCFPLAVWPLLAWWSTPSSDSPPSQGWSRRRLAVVLALLLAAADWKTQRDFWWDDEYQARQQPEERPQALLQTASYCPPWWKDTLRMRLCDAFRQLQRWQEAEGWARQRLQANPNDAYRWQSLADILDRSQQWQAADQAWSECHLRDPLNPAVLYFWARSLMAAHQPERARQKVEESLSIHPGSEQARALLQEIESASRQP